MTMQISPITAPASMRGCILTPNGFVDGVIEAGPDGRIGHDIMEGGSAAARVAELHARHGTTAMLATTMTAPHADLVSAFGALNEVIAGRTPRAARVLGVHLEGLFINPGKLGAQPNYARPVDLAEIAQLNAMAPIRLITLAPETAGNMSVIEQLCAAGYRVQIGHTLGSYEDGVQALARGAGGFTRLFNAMTALHHREPGMVGATLAHVIDSEIIPTWCMRTPVRSE